MSWIKKLNPANISPIIGMPLNGVALHPVLIWVELKCSSYSVAFAPVPEGFTYSVPGNPKTITKPTTKFRMKIKSNISYWILISSPPFVVN